MPYEPSKAAIKILKMAGFAVVTPLALVKQTAIFRPFRPTAELTEIIFTIGQVILGTHSITLYPASGGNQRFVFTAKAGWTLEYTPDSLDAVTARDLPMLAGLRPSALIMRLREIRNRQCPPIKGIVFIP